MSTVNPFADLNTNLPDTDFSNFSLSGQKSGARLYAEAGEHDFQITSVGDVGVYRFDETWREVKLDLVNAAEQKALVDILLPTKSPLMNTRKGPSDYVFKRTLAFFEAVGAPLDTAKMIKDPKDTQLRDLLTRVFVTDRETLVGMKFRGILGYEKGTYHAKFLGQGKGFQLIDHEEHPYLTTSGETVECPSKDALILEAKNNLNLRYQSFPKMLKTLPLDGAENAWTVKPAKEVPQLKSFSVKG